MRKQEISEIKKLFTERNCSITRICGCYVDGEKNNLVEEIRMAKLSKKDIEELREFCSLGCEFSGTEEIVREIADEVLKENGCELCQCDDASVTDWDDDTICTLEDFARAFWEKAVEKILNVVETQGR